MTIIFLTSSLIWLLICIEHAWNLVWGQVWMHGFVFVQWFIFLIDFKGFFHYVAHSIGPPSSLSPWFIILHLWSTFRPYGHPPSHGRERTTSHDVMQHHLLWGMQDSCFTWINHIFPPPTFWSMHQWVDIVVLVNDV
jgi:hypothetical protein